jgi:hypothetical protein
LERKLQADHEAQVRAQAKRDRKAERNRALRDRQS